MYYKNFLQKNKKTLKKLLTYLVLHVIINESSRVSDKDKRGSVGIGRRARLRILWQLCRVGSSPIFRIQYFQLKALS